MGIRGQQAGQSRLAATRWGSARDSSSLAISSLLRDPELFGRQHRLTEHLADMGETATGSDSPGGSPGPGLRVRDRRRRKAAIGCDPTRPRSVAGSAVSSCESAARGGASRPRRGPGGCWRPRSEGRTRWTIRRASSWAAARPRPPRSSRVVRGPGPFDARGGHVERLARRPDLAPFL